jgi:hypothetical protein
MRSDVMVKSRVDRLTAALKDAGFDVVSFNEDVAPKTMAKNGVVEQRFISSGMVEITVIPIGGEIVFTPFHTIEDGEE